MSKETLIEKLEAELAKPPYEGCDYRSGVRKAIAIVRQHEAEQPQNVVERVAAIIEPAFFGEAATGWSPEHVIEMQEKARQKAKSAIAALRMPLPEPPK